MHYTNEKAVFSYKAVGPDNSDKINKIITFIKNTTSNSYPIKQVYCERYWRSQIGRNLLALSFCKDNKLVAFITLNTKNLSLSKILGAFHTNVFEFKHIFTEQLTSGEAKELSCLLNDIINRNFGNQRSCKICTNFPKLIGNQGEHTDNPNSEFINQFFKGYEKVSLPSYISASEKASNLDMFIDSSNDSSLAEVFSVNPEMTALSNISFQKIGICVSRLQNEMYSRQIVSELNKKFENLRTQYLVVNAQNVKNSTISQEIERAGFKKCAEVKSIIENGIIIYSRTKEDTLSDSVKDILYRVQSA